MRKTIILGALIAALGIGALAHAKDVIATGGDNAVQAEQSSAPKVSGDRDSQRERHGETRTKHPEAHDSRRERHNEVSERRAESAESNRHR